MSWSVQVLTFPTFLLNLLWLNLQTPPKMYRILLESPNTTKRLLIRLINLWAKHQAGEQNVMAIENIIFVRKWNFADFFFLFPSHEMRKKNSQNVWDTKSFHFSLILKLSEFTSWTHFVLAREVKNFPLRKIFWNHRVDL